METPMPATPHHPDFHRVRDAGQIVNDTFGFVRDNVRELGRGLLVIAGPPILLAGASAYLLASRFMVVADSFDDLQLADLGPLAAAYGVTLLSVSLGLIAVFAVTLAYVVIYLRQGPGEIDAPTLWSETLRCAGGIVTTWLAMLALIMAGFIVVLVPYLGAIAFLVGVVYLLPVFGLAYAVRVLEGGGAWQAIGRSRRLVRGYWATSFGTFFIMYLIAGVLAFTLMLLFGALALLVQSLVGESGTLGGLLGTILTTAGYLPMILYAIPTVASVFLYFSLVERHEGAGLAARVEALGEVEAAGPDPN